MVARTPPRLPIEIVPGTEYLARLRAQSVHDAIEEFISAFTDESARFQALPEPIRYEIACRLAVALGLRLIPTPPGLLTEKPA